MTDRNDTGQGDSPGAGQRDGPGAGHRDARVPEATVLKLGGELIEDEPRSRAMGAVIAELSRTERLVVVHGGGRDIDVAMARAGLVKRQVDGLRITDDATFEVVVSVLAGVVNTRLVAAVTAAGGTAVGLTGVDAGIVTVDKAPPHVATDGTVVDLGRVGLPRSSPPPRLLARLCTAGYVPVMASIGVGTDGELYNVNADTCAAHVATAVGARRLVVAGGTAGVLDADGRTLPVLTPLDIDALVASGTASAGMVAKLTACRDALAGGVTEVIVADGRDRGALATIVRQGPIPAGCTTIQPSLAGVAQGARLATGAPRKR